MAKRQRDSNSFQLSRDTTAKEILQCFALAYFAATSKNQRSIDGLIDALCEDNYKKYERYMQYPALDADTTGSDRITAVSEFSGELNEFKIKIGNARKTLRSIFEKSKQRKQKGLSKYTKDLETKRNNAIEILKNKDIELKKIFNNIKKKRVSIKKSVISRYNKKLYNFTAFDYKNNKENEDAKKWIESSYWTAEAIGKVIGNYSDYVYAHSTSPSAREIKEIPLSVISSMAASLLEIEDLQPDMFQPADIYAINRRKLPKIISDYANVMTSSYIGKEKISHTPLLKLIRTQIQTKECVPISLKKSLSPNPPIKFVGSTFKIDESHAPLVDSYTHAIEYFSSNFKNLQQIIEEFVEVNSIEYKHNTETFNVNFALNYSKLNDKLSKIISVDGVNKKVELTDEFYKLTTASMTWNGLPTNKDGKTIGAYTGGAGFTQVSSILKRYPKSRTIFSKIVRCRTDAFKFALLPYTGENPSIPSIINFTGILNKKSDRQAIYYSIIKNLENNDEYKNSNDKTKIAQNVYAKYLIALNSQLLYSKNDEKEMKNIDNALKDFTSSANEKKILSLLPKELLGNLGWVRSGKTIKPGPKTKKTAVKRYTKIAYQEERASKLEALYFYTEGSASSNGSGNFEIDSAILKEEFKKRITLTIYGLITKKGSKIFLSEPEINFEKQRTGKKPRTMSDALGFRTMPYFIVGNASE
ncbi:MAG: hypothetical protein ACO3CQ_02675 [Candidatus Nanopelagicaceae bacterium]